MARKSLGEFMAKKKGKAGRVEFTAPQDWIDRLQKHADKKGIATASLIKFVMTEWMTAEEKAERKGEAE